MSEERRYSETEIEKIFEIAAREGSGWAEHPARDGLTLEELQSIGEEVGLSPARVSEAAAMLDRQHRDRGRLTVAGVPLGVRMRFDLPDAPTDREWGVLVTELRRTFGANGRISSAGELREWRNGNLHAVVEPTQEGYQLRMGTRKGQAPALALTGLFMFLMAFGMFAGGGVIGPIVLSAVGLLFLGQLGRLPTWAELREAQMERIGQRAIELISLRGKNGDPHE